MGGVPKDTSTSRRIGIGNASILLLLAVHPHASYTESVVGATVTLATDSAEAYKTYYVTMAEIAKDRDVASAQYDIANISATDASEFSYITPTASGPSASPYGGGGVYLAQQSGLGLLQGGANLINGLQDSAVSMVLLGLPGGALISSFVGEIQSPDWSRDMFVHETDAAHDWSKFAGATGVEMLAGGVTKLASSCDDVGRLGNTVRRFFGGGCFVAGTPVTLSELPTTSQLQEALWSNDSFLTDITDQFSGGTALLQAAPATKQTVQVAIEDVPLGARVPTKNPNRWDYDDSLPEPDEVTWARFAFTIQRTDGGIVDAELIRPRSWIQANGIRAGHVLPMHIEELQIDGEATVTSIESCPPIAAGDGSAVTGRFVTRQVDEIAVVKVLGPHGQIETIEGTTIHPVWSVDQQDWIALGELEIGETLSSENGPATVLDVQVKHESTPVFNIEIHGEHVYQVGELGLLVHNTYSSLPWGNAGARQAAKAIEAGETSILVGSRDEASEVVWRMFSSQGYTNTTGRTGNDIRQIIGSKAGTYHWDDVLDDAGNVVGHGVDNAHGGMRHVQIHLLPDGEIIRIFFP